MCGIAGCAAAPGARVDRETIRAMALAIAHRGPDDAGEYFDDASGIGLTHRRLAIVDLSDGSHQPMLDPETGSVLLYNGELFNFRDLRRELEARGHRFRSPGDTEVVLRAYAEWGRGCFERFAGMFAIAIWDARDRRLWLARDATGIKPLYVHEVAGQGIFFASEIKAFLELPGFPREIDSSSLGQFLEFGYAFEGRRTIFRGVEKVLPGEILEIENGRLRARHRHFRPPEAREGDDPGQEARVEQLHAALSQVVREHLVADVPVGMLLSGGIDSSLIAALAARESELTTVTMGFAESRIDERPEARKVAEFLGTRHLEVEIQPGEIAEEVAGAAWVFDDLFADWGTVSTRMVYRKFRDLGFKVALVGEGADELFGGYSAFDNTDRGAGPLRLFRLYQRYAGRRYGSYFREFRAILGRYLEAAHGDLFEAVRRFEVERQLPNNYVMKVDKAAMSVSLEARTPYLDRRIADLAYATPRTWLQRDGESKWLLRKVARQFGRLPEVTAGRLKFGASIAVTWLEEVATFRAFARDVVLDRAGWCDELGLRSAMERYFAGGGGYRFPHPLSVLNHVAWRLLLLNLWSKHYLHRALASPVQVAPVIMPPWAEVAVESAASDRVPGLVSAIVPVHDRPRLLAEAVDSVLAQTYRPIEILIVDDGSTDETPQVAQAIAARHPDIVRVIHRRQGGPGLARESGRRAARGEFLQYLDSDDVLAPRKFELQVAALQQRQEAAAAYGITQEVNSDGRVELNPDRPSDRAIDRMFPLFLRIRWWHTSTPLYRAEICDRIGPWTDLWLEEDWEYDCRVAALRLPVCFVPEVVSQHRNVSNDRLSQGEVLDPRRLAFRARAHELIYTHATRAGIGRITPEMRHYARELFLLCRQCGAGGLEAESKRLFGLARHASTPWRAAGLDFRLYRAVVALVGWRSAGRLATIGDRIRFGYPRG